MYYLFEFFWPWMEVIYKKNKLNYVIAGGSYTKVAIRVASSTRRRAHMIARGCTK